MSFQSLLLSLSQQWRRRLLARRHARRGQQLYQQSEFAQAAAEYELSLEYSSPQPLVLFNLGLALYKTGRKAEARARWQAVLEETDNLYLIEQAQIMLRQFG